jgi:hypothetical protein
MQMADQDSLDSSIQLSPISIQTKCSILTHFWAIDVRPDCYYDSELDYDAYFSYYTEQCSLALHDGGRHISARSHQDIIDIAKNLKKSMTREDLKQILRSKLSVPRPANEDELVNSSIDLTARLVLMIELGCLQYGFTGRKQLTWNENSLDEFVRECFGAPQCLGKETVKLERIFNARNLGRIAGIQIEWTKNLADHLRLIDEDKKVAIFHHASFLEYQLKK